MKIHGKKCYVTRILVFRHTILNNTDEIFDGMTVISICVNSFLKTQDFSKILVYMENYGVIHSVYSIVPVLISTVQKRITYLYKKTIL